MYNDALWDAKCENALDDSLTARYTMDLSATQAESFLIGSIYTHLDLIVRLAEERRGIAEMHAKEIKEAIDHLLLWHTKSCETAMFDVLEQIDEEREDETDEKTECGSACDHDGEGTDKMA